MAVSRSKPQGQLQNESPSASADPARRPPTNIKDLPENLRTQLPPLQISGSVYSSDSRSRLLIVNGQPMHEGDVIGSDLRLLQIQPKAAIFEFKAQRFLVNF